MTLLIAEHTGKQHFILVGIGKLIRFFELFVFVTCRTVGGFIGNSRALCPVKRTVKKRPVAVLFTVKKAFKCKNIGRIIQIF